MSAAMQTDIKPIRVWDLPTRLFHWSLVASFATASSLVRVVLPEIYGEHPEFEQIDWERTQWFNSKLRFRPDFGKSLEQHGLTHKSLIRFRTPALEGIKRSTSPGRQAF